MAEIRDDDPTAIAALSNTQRAAINQQRIINNYLKQQRRDKRDIAVALRDVPQLLLPKRKAGDQGSPEAPVAKKSRPEKPLVPNAPEQLLYVPVPHGNHEIGPTLRWRAIGAETDLVHKTWQQAYCRYLEAIAEIWPPLVPGDDGSIRQTRWNQHFSWLDGQVNDHDIGLAKDHADDIFPAILETDIQLRTRYAVKPLARPRSRKRRPRPPFRSPLGSRRRLRVPHPRPRLSSSNSSKAGPLVGAEASLGNGGDGPFGPGQARAQTNAQPASNAPGGATTGVECHSETFADGSRDVGHQPRQQTSSRGTAHTATPSCVEAGTLPEAATSSTAPRAYTSAPIAAPPPTTLSLGPADPPRNDDAAQSFLDDIDVDFLDHSAVRDKIVTPYDADQFEHYIRKHHLVEHYALPNLLRHGFPMGDFPDLDESVEFKNHRSVAEHADFVEESLKDEVDAGRMDGPYQTRLEVETELGSCVQVSPILVSVQTQAPGEKDKLRMCRHLSKGNDVHPSSNSYVDKKKFPTRSTTATKIGEYIANAPPGTQAMSLDISKFHRTVPILPAHKKWFVVRGPRGYYIDHCAPFGGSGSSGNASKIATAIEDIWEAEMVDDPDHYEDDGIVPRTPLATIMEEDTHPESPTPHRKPRIPVESVVVGTTTYHYAYSRASALAAIEPLRVPWHPVKWTEFLFEIVYIGFLWNLPEKRVSLPEQKRLKFLRRVDEFRDLCKRGRCSLNDVEKIHGSLCHICFVYPEGRSYLADITAFQNRFDPDEPLITRYPPPSLYTALKWQPQTGHLETTDLAIVLGRRRQPHPSLAGDATGPSNHTARKPQHLPPHPNIFTLAKPPPVPHQGPRPVPLQPRPAPEPAPPTDASKPAPRPRKPKPGNEIQHNEYRPAVLAKDRLRTWSSPYAVEFKAKLGALFPPENVDKIVNALHSAFAPGTHDTVRGCRRRVELLTAFAAEHIGEVGGGTVKGWLSAVRAWHDVAGATWHGETRLLELVRKTAHKEGAKHSKPPRPPATLEHMLALSKSLDRKNGEDLTVLACALATFWGCRRLGETTVPKGDAFDPKVHIARSAYPSRTSDGLALHIPWTKSTGEKGGTLVLAERDDELCPVKAYSQHLALNHVVPRGEMPLFSFRDSKDGLWRPLTKPFFLHRCKLI
ncbi:hypothetical protein HMN09_00269200 [Mycena chlorophos]|uniref:Uncharacterized protein n=1 Tax=Mycena chlorophos TaxID=658473 RepID=A0A8H6TMD0_MYCCL|nr:hypothetical protein HMN09_00269200 [Mycena chlorophos]